MRRIEEEKSVVEQMIRLYCRRKEGNRSLCPSCQELLEYAQGRSIRGGEADLQEVSYPLLPAGDEGAYPCGDALVGTPNDFVSPCRCHQACAA